MRSPSATNLIVGRGSMWFNRFAAGTRTKIGWLHVGNAKSVAQTLTAEQISSRDNMTSDGGNLKTVSVGKDIALKITGEEFSRDNLALMMMGLVSALSQGAASASAERMTPAGGAEQGMAYRTEFRNISNVVVKVIAATKTLGTDYTIEDPVAGLIRIVEGGGIADVDDVDVDYDYAADTSKTIQIGTEGLIEGSLLFVPDPVDGPKLEGELWIVSFTPDSDLNFIQDSEFGEFTLNCAVVKDVAGHPTNPYGQLVIRP